VSEIVTCWSDYTYAQQPVGLTWQGKQYRVSKIMDRWRSPQGLHFRVLSHDKRIFTLTYHEAEDQWSIQTDEIPDTFASTNPD
jgi:hypothetical protein